MMWYIFCDQSSVSASGALSSGRTEDSVVCGASADGARWRRHCFLIVFFLLLFLTSDIEGIWADFILSTAYEAIKARGYEYVEWS
jgi:hypothetical protein